MEQFFEIYEGHRERLREKIRRVGVDSMQPREVLEFLLSLALPRQDVDELARDLLDYFGALDEVLNAEIPQLQQVEGIGRGVAEWIALVGEIVLGARAVMDDGQEVEIDCLFDLLRSLDLLQRRYPPPCCVQMCRNEYGGIIYQRVITPSRMWGAPEVLRDALNDVMVTDAKGVILLQFVGKLYPEADEYDLEYLDKYAFTLHLLGCSLLDMVLISYGGVTSLRQEGKIPDYSLGRGGRMLREDYLVQLREERTQRLLAQWRPEDAPGDEL